MKNSNMFFFSPTVFIKNKTILERHGEVAGQRTEDVSAPHC